MVARLDNSDIMQHPLFNLIAPQRYDVKPVFGLTGCKVSRPAVLALNAGISDAPVHQSRYASCVTQDA